MGSKGATAVVTRMQFTRDGVFNYSVTGRTAMRYTAGDLVAERTRNEHFAGENQC